ncbi:hypothetical protein Zmor_007064 [Zophobas morio]|uniref:Uncharacterized protein n=1 Tax=Zophobas morio TaxID=2755281 RepID=A0AA38IW24_9CUCU|nr:hypothetical protein Zmor_007064 [Zophobas morio]
MVDKAPSISMELEQYYLSLEVIEAIQNNDVPRLKLLHKCGTDFNMCDEDGNTVFHLAIQNHAKLDTFEYLLTLDDVITKDDFNSVPRTPIQEAFRINSGEIYASRLIESGCRVDCFYPRGSKVLHLAVKNKWIEVAELLIERGFQRRLKNAELLRGSGVENAGRSGLAASTRVLRSLRFGVHERSTSGPTCDPRN